MLCSLDVHYFFKTLLICAMRQTLFAQTCKIDTWLGTRVWNDGGRLWKNERQRANRIFGLVSGSLGIPCLYDTLPGIFPSTELARPSHKNQNPHDTAFRSYGDKKEQEKRTSSFYAKRGPCYSNVSRTVSNLRSESSKLEFGSNEITSMKTKRKYASRQTKKRSAER